MLFPSNSNSIEVCSLCSAVAADFAGRDLPRHGNERLDRAHGYARHLTNRSRLLCVPALNSASVRLCVCDFPSRAAIRNPTTRFLLSTLCRVVISAFQAAPRLSCDDALVFHSLLQIRTPAARCTATRWRAPSAASPASTAAVPGMLGSRDCAFFAHPLTHHFPLCWSSSFDVEVAWFLSGVSALTWVCFPCTARPATPNLAPTTQSAQVPCHRTRVRFSWVSFVLCLTRVALFASRA